MAITRPLKIVETNPKQLPAKATVIWLHGLGASGYDFVDFIPELNLPMEARVRFVFPHAPVRPVTNFNHMKMRAWFDVVELSEDGLQDEAGIAQSHQLITALIEQESAHLPSSKIFLAGFSQGGAMALHCGLRYPKALGGILVLSGFLVLADKLQAEKSTANKKTPIMMLHGERDPIVPMSWAEHSRDCILNLGYNVAWHNYPMEHTVCGEEARDIGAWILKTINNCCAASCRNL